MTQNRKQLFGVFFLLYFFKSMFISFVLMGCDTRPTDLQVEHTESGNWEEEYMLLCFLFLTFNYGVLSFIFKEFHNLWLANPLGQGSCREKKILCPKEVCAWINKTFLCQHWPFAMMATTLPCTGLGPVDLGDSCWHNKKDKMNSEWPSFYTNFFRQEQKWRIGFPVGCTPIRASFQSKWWEGYSGYVILALIYYNYW